jgi:hypothetical protein
MNSRLMVLVLAVGVFSKNWRGYGHYHYNRVS